LLSSPGLDACGSEVAASVGNADVPLPVIGVVEAPVFMYIQMQAGHSQGAITERYIHAAAVMFPGAADKTEARLFGAPGVEIRVET
jgi:hypothetical protein